MFAIQKIQTLVGTNTKIRKKLLSSPPLPPPPPSLPRPLPVFPVGREHEPDQELPPDTNSHGKWMRGRGAGRKQVKKGRHGDVLWAVKTRTQSLLLFKIPLPTLNKSLMLNTQFSGKAATLPHAFNIFCLAPSVRPLGAEEAGSEGRPVTGYGRNWKGPAWPHAGLSPSRRRSCSHSHSRGGHFSNPKSVSGLSSEPACLRAWPDERCPPCPGLPQDRGGQPVPSRSSTLRE